jgi:UDP-N-acetylmuramyl pentapeptide phosphotransferase/UDP-N-acetylglucosamine-1-phosphate transferase
MVAALVSALLTTLWIRLARARRIEDLPGPRRLHESATPRGGGIGISLVMIATSILLAMRTDGSVAWLGTAAAIAAFSAIGLLDDLWPLLAWAKLLLQVVAAALLLVALDIPPPIAWFLPAVLAIAYGINVWNFMDGSNGLVAGQSLLIAVAVSVWPGVSFPLRLGAMSLAGACVGFLPFNLLRARVFLGDVGSHALGASVLVLLCLAWREGALQPAQALLMVSAILLDASLTLARRILSGRKFWQPHREHLYQYAVRSGHSHVRVCLGYTSWTTMATGVAWFAGAGLASGRTSWLVSIVLTVGCLIHFGLRRHWLGSRTTRKN